MPGRDPLSVARADAGAEKLREMRRESISTAFVQSSAPVIATLESALNRLRADPACAAMLGGPQRPRVQSDSAWEGGGDIACDWMHEGDDCGTRFLVSLQGGFASSVTITGFAVVVDAARTARIVPDEDVLGGVAVPGFDVDPAGFVADFEAMVAEHAAELAGGCGVELPEPDVDVGGLRTPADERIGAREECGGALSAVRSTVARLHGMFG